MKRSGKETLRWVLVLHLNTITFGYPLSIRKERRVKDAGKQLAGNGRLLLLDH